LAVGQIRKNASFSLLTEYIGGRLCFSPMKLDQLALVLLVNLILTVTINFWGRALSTVLSASLSGIFLQKKFAQLTSGKFKKH
jgi:hypothetical protein